MAFTVSNYKVINVLSEIVGLISLLKPSNCLSFIENFLQVSGALPKCTMAFVYSVIHFFMCGRTWIVRWQNTLGIDFSISISISVEKKKILPSNPSEKAAEEFDI